jgi:predicted regulator of Ras-like GTPase activity (Roadblock/LC7/MglB family)
MILKGAEFKKAMLLGLVVAAAPSFYYPYAFGWSGAVAGGAAVLLFEFAYYGLMFYVLWRRASTARILGAACAAVAFRLGLGLVFAALLAALFGLPVADALSTGMYRYLPGILLHVLLVPFMLQSVFDFRRPPRRAPQATRRADMPKSERPRMPAADAPSWGGATDHLPDFEAAVAHIAAYSTVRLALLVDDDGLCVARAGRPHGDTDLWAPVTQLLFGAIRRELRRTPSDALERFELTQGEQRMAVVRVESFYLAVLFDGTTDELVHVRIAQAVEMIRRYAEHKYPRTARAAATEVSYV